MLQHDRHMHFVPLGMRPEAPNRVPRVPFEMKVRLPLSYAHDYDTLFLAIDLVKHDEACGVFCTDSAAKSVSVCFGKLRAIDTRFKGAINSLPVAFLLIALLSGEPTTALGLILTKPFWATWLKKGGSSLAARFVRDYLVRNGSLRTIDELPLGELCIVMWREGWVITRNREKSLIIGPPGAAIPDGEPPRPPKG